MLCIAHGHAVIVLYISCSAEDIEDAGECLWNCNSIDKTRPQPMVVSHVFGLLGGVGDANDHCFHVGGLRFRR